MPPSSAPRADDPASLAPPAPPPDVSPRHASPHTPRDSESAAAPPARPSPPQGLEPAARSLWTALDARRGVLGGDFVDALLREPAYAPVDVVAVLPDEVPRPWRGLARGALYRTLLQELLLWGGSGIFPLTFATGPLLPCCTTNAEGEGMNETRAAEEGNPMFRTLAVARAARERSVPAFTAALDRIGATGVARLLGCRSTAGSVQDGLPPLREHLVEAAAVRVGRKRGAKISVAARALMKHCGRLGEGWDSCYWGREEVVMHGGDEEKNRRAAHVVEQVLDQCVWMNLHHAPGGTRVLELRVESGHGVRWHAQDGVFRGFLEPHSKEIAMQRKEERKAREREKEGETADEGVDEGQRDAAENCECDGESGNRELGKDAGEEGDGKGNGDSGAGSRKLGAKVAQAMAIFSV